MDATNLNSKKRAAYVRDLRCKLPGVEMRCCLVLCNPIELPARDAARERHVGPEVIDRMLHSFQPPHYYEGWDGIDLYYTSDEDVDIGYLMAESVTFDQQNHHHTLTLGKHMEKAADAMSDYTGTIAAWYHDIGKLFCQTFDDEGEAHYYDHHNIGSYIFLCSDLGKGWAYSDEYKRLLFVANVIAWHMTPYQCMSEEDFRQWAIKRRMPESMIDTIWELHKADLEAH